MPTARLCRVDGIPSLHAYFLMVPDAA
jgi:hypothetical protein